MKSWFYDQRWILLTSVVLVIAVPIQYEGYLYKIIGFFTLVASLGIINKVTKRDIDDFLICLFFPMVVLVIFGMLIPHNIDTLVVVARTCVVCMLYSLIVAIKAAHD